MCHVYDGTIDVDRSFLKGKELLKENLKIILAQKKRLKMSSSGISKIYMLWVYSLLVKTMWFLDI
jgi:hypothetical protein